MSIVKALRAISLILAVVLALLGAIDHFLAPYPSWVSEMHENPESASYPRNFLFFKIDFGVKEDVRGNVTFLQEQVKHLDLTPNCYVLTTDVFNSRSSDSGWLNKAVYRCSEVLYYEPLQYGRAKYVRYFAFRANSTEYYFVLMFTSEPGQATLYLSRLKLERSHLVESAGYSIAVIITVTALLSFCVESLSMDRLAKAKEVTLQYLKTKYRNVYGLRFFSLERPLRPGTNEVITEGVFWDQQGQQHIFTVRVADGKVVEEHST
jgi:hypothetical protein